MAVGGLSGVGKSALAGALAPRLGRAPGALWLRSDLERKAMFAVEETVHLPASAYAEDVTRGVYRRVIEKARVALRAGQAVVLDATFATAAERNAAADAAVEAGAAFVGLFLDAPLATRLARIELGKRMLPTPMLMLRRARKRSPSAREGGRRSTRKEISAGPRFSPWRGSRAVDDRGKAHGRSKRRRAKS